MSSIPNQNLIAVAIGATIGVISAAAAIMYAKAMERQQQLLVKTNIDRVNQKVSELQLQIGELRAQQANKKRRLIKRQVYSNENTYSGTEEVDIDTFSTAGTDIGDEEFFDCSDDEGAIDIGNGTLEGIGSDDSDLLELDREHEDRTLHTVSYHKAKSLLQGNPRDPEIVWRFARACYDVHDKTNDSEAMKNYVYEGCNACELILDVKHAELYKWYAILVGKKSQFLPIKGKIENGFLFKEYVQKAMEINPHDNFVHYLMGRFKYEVSELSWIEKKVASTIFGNVPSATYEDAIPHLEAAEKLAKKPFYPNQLLLGKCYIAVGKYQEALPLLRQVSESPAVSEEDYQDQSEAQKLLDKYSSYA